MTPKVWVKDAALLRPVERSGTYLTHLLAILKYTFIYNSI
jgi:hypothetical protein